MRTPDPSIVGRMHKSTDPAILDRRRQYVEDMLASGFKQRAIADALGITEGALSEFILSRGIKTPRRSPVRGQDVFTHAGFRIGHAGPAYWSLSEDDRLALALAADKARKTISEYLVDHYLERRDAA